MLCLLAPSTFGSIASRAGIISLLGLGGISLCELSKAFFYLLQRLPHFLWIRWPFTVGMGCGVWRSFAFSTHCLVNEPESGYCRLSSSDRDSAVPCLIDISLSSISTQNPPIKPHSTFSLITKHWLACQCPGQDLMNTHLMFAHLYPLSLSLCYSSKTRGRRAEDLDWDWTCRKFISTKPLILCSGLNLWILSRRVKESTKEVR